MHIASVLCAGSRLVCIGQGTGEVVAELTPTTIRTARKAAVETNRIQEA